MTDNESGLYSKYAVIRYDRKPVTWAFVLEDKDPLAIPALQAYRNAAIDAGKRALANDLTVQIMRLREHHAMDRWDAEHQPPESDSDAMSEADVGYFRERGLYMRTVRQAILIEEAASGVDDD